MTKSSEQNSNTPSKIVENSHETSIKAKPFKLWQILLCILMLLVALGWFVYWWSYSRYFVETDDAYVRADIVLVSSRIGGYIRDVQVQDNQHVSAGTLLANVDQANLLEDIEQIKAELLTAKTNLDVIRAGKAKINAEIQAHQAQIAQAQSINQSSAVLQAQYQRNYTRQQQLARAQISSIQNVEDAKSDVERNAAELNAAQAQVRNKQQQLKVFTEELNIQNAKYEQAQALVKQHEAKLKKAYIALSYTHITAPISGTIGQRKIRLGQTVSVGTPLMAIVPDQRYVIANFKETQIANMSIGQKVKIEVDAMAGQVFTGTVDSFAPASGAQFALLPPDNATGNFTKVVQRIPVKIRIDLKHDVSSLKPGMSVIVKVDTRNG